MSNWPHMKQRSRLRVSNDRSARSASSGTASGDHAATAHSAPRRSAATALLLAASSGSAVRRSCNAASSRRSCPARRPMDSAASVASGAMGRSQASASASASAVLSDSFGASVAAAAPPGTNAAAPTFRPAADVTADERERAACPAASRTSMLVRCWRQRWVSGSLRISALTLGARLIHEGGIPPTQPSRQESSCIRDVTSPRSWLVAGGPARPPAEPTRLRRRS